MPRKPRVQFSRAIYYIVTSGDVEGKGQAMRVMGMGLDVEIVQPSGSRRNR